MDYSFVKYFGFGLEICRSLLGLSLGKLSSLALGLGLGKLSSLALGLGLDVCRLNYITG